jgi:hypothetical protein
MASLTLLQLRDRVGWAADVTLSASGRYPQAMVDAWINEAAQAYEIERSQRAGAVEKRYTATGTASASLVQGFPQNQIIQLPADCQQVRAVWVEGSSGRYQLTWLDEQDRWTTLNNPAAPLGCRLTTLADGTMALRVWPAIAASTAFEVIYAPGATTLTLDSDLWPYEPGTEDMLIASVACRILDRDGVPEPQAYQALQNRIASATERLRRVMAAKDPGVLRVRDTRGLSSSRDLLP